MTFRTSIITLYPDMFPGPLGMSLAGNALTNGKWELETIPLREFGEGKHHRVDDTPAGGGAGMVLKADVLANAIDSIGEDNRPRLLMSPRGKPLTQKRVRELAAGDGAVIICGRFEGVDQRVIDTRNLEEVSIGDYILSGGEPAALVMLDAIIRLLPGVMGNDESGTHESFESGLLEHPHYTRPQEWEGQSIPGVLTSGNHKLIEKWKEAQSQLLTEDRRPDLLDTPTALSTTDLATLEKLEMSLWQSETRFDDDYMETILADDFREFGRSGKTYARDEMFFGATSKKKIDAIIYDFNITTLSQNIAIVTYISELNRDGILERSNRSSIWRREKDGCWVLNFHQGTPIH